MSKPFYTRSRLTKRRMEVLKAVFHFVRKNSIPPSLQELADSMGLPDRQSAHNHLLVLRYQNLVEWSKRKSRSLRITPSGLALLGKKETSDTNSQ